MDDELKEKAESAAKTYFGTDNLDVYCIPEHDAFLDAYEVGYAAALSDDGWTYCDDRLPEEDGYYLATVGSVGIDPDETTCHELNWFKGKWYLPNDEMIEIGPVIAWRRKPEPAKGRDG